MKTPSVFEVSPTDLTHVQYVMDLGFANDPTVKWILDTPAAFAYEHHRYVALCAEPAFACGGVHAVDDFRGAAIWYPPGVGVSDDQYDAFLKVAHAPERLVQYDEMLELCDRHRPAGQHWTLELIAVDPTIQGQGIGAALMEYGLAQCDLTLAPAFLISSNALNLPFYKRLGFQQLDAIEVPGLPTLYPMCRPPVTA